MGELWSVLNLLDPASFGDADAFEESYGDMHSAEQVGLTLTPITLALTLTLTRFYAIAARQIGPVTAVKLYELGTKRVVPGRALVWCPRLTQWTMYKEAQPVLTREVASEI